MQNKEFLYVGHYIDTNGNYILKIGTTDNLKRRRGEHNYNYRRSDSYTLPKDSKFEYDFWLPLSKYNTLRFEDRNRARWQEENVGEFVRNDRFNCGKAKPHKVIIKVRKEYEVIL